MTQEAWYAHCESPEYQASLQSKWLRKIEREGQVILPSLCPACLDINRDTVAERVDRCKRGVDWRYCLKCGCGECELWVGTGQWVCLAENYSDDRVQEDRVLRTVAAHPGTFH